MQALNADHAFLLAAGAVSWIVDFQYPGFFFQNRNYEFLMNERDRDLLGRTSQYPQVPNSDQSLNELKSYLFPTAYRRTTAGLVNTTYIQCPSDLV